MFPGVARSGGSLSPTHGEPLGSGRLRDRARRAGPCHQGLVCVSVKPRLGERRQQRLRDLRARRELLCAELAETQGRLMVRPSRWPEQCECPPPPTPGPT